ncbi:R-linalool synthase QH1, chloroplastic isoform X2 [Lactuca sativa]|nr:R-linalool synthase QH1, chloroplastic isoform X2 [Lactuca sativa]
MGSICIYCMSLPFSPTSNHRRIRNYMGGFQKQYLTTQPTTMAVTTNAPIVRRSANYPPSLWSYEYLQSLTNNYVGEEYETRSLSLKEEVKMMISEDAAVQDPLSTLKFVDDLQRLGVSYHFEYKINSVLKILYHCYFDSQEKWNKSDLNLKALGFRLLRQHGYLIPQEIFEDIRDETGNIKAQLREDIVGMLNLYEASFLAVEDESILDEARELTRQCLKEMLEKNSIGNDQCLVMLISHALELPLLWRPQRFEAIWFIEAYKTRSDKNSLLLELAELDFNVLQGIHQEDLKYSSRWWNDLGWDKKFSFARDRLVESFMWAVGANYEPRHGVLRRNITKLISLVNVIDDVYDVYGTLDELKQFSSAVKRWDINAIEELPDYMKICFLGFYNTINEMAYSTLINQELLVLPIVKKAWADYCDANTVEAEWFNSGYIPTLEEYLKNSCITISLPVILSNIYFFTSSDITGEAMQNVVHCSSMILRLADDLGTSSAELQRGDIPKSIQCYMHETGATEENAREYIKKLIMQTWKKLNKERMSVNYPRSGIFIECATNLGRMGQFTYQHASDAFGSPDD